MNTSPSLSSLVQYFFTQHLCEHRRSSAKTVLAYRDTFRLCLASYNRVPVMPLPP
jgi:hypothetical protein